MAEYPLESELSLLGLEERTIQCPNRTVKALDYEMLQKNRDVLTEEIKFMNRSESMKEKSKSKKAKEAEEAQIKCQGAKASATLWHPKKKKVTTISLVNPKPTMDISAELQPICAALQNGGPSMALECPQVDCATSDSMPPATDRVDSAGKCQSKPACQDLHNNTSRTSESTGAQRQTGSGGSRQSLVHVDVEGCHMSPEEFSRRYHQRASPHALHDESADESCESQQAHAYLAEQLAEQLAEDSVSQSTSNAYTSHHFSITQETELSSLNSNYSAAYAARQEALGGRQPCASDRGGLSELYRNEAHAGTSSEFATATTFNGPHIKRPEIFSFKTLFGRPTNYVVPERRPPDYVKIAIILLLPAMPCALPALIWALKARSLRKHPHRMAEAWQYSHRAFCCCMISLACLAIFLSSFSFTVMLKKTQCSCPTEKPPAGPPLPATRPPRPLKPSPEQPFDILRDEKDGEVMHVQASNKGEKTRPQIYSGQLGHFLGHGLGNRGVYDDQQQDEEAVELPHHDKSFMGGLT